MQTGGLQYWTTVAAAAGWHCCWLLWLALLVAAVAGTGVAGAAGAAGGVVAGVVVYCKPVACRS